MTQMAEINVSGTGKVSALPDGMRLDLTIASRKDDYSQSLSLLNARVDATAAAMLRAGVSESIVTKSYSVAETWSDQFDKEKRKFLGYLAIQKMTVTVPIDNALLERVIKELAAGDGKPKMSLSFVVRNTEAMEREARITAVKKAKEAAADLAEASDLELVAVKSINFRTGSSMDYSSLSVNTLDGIHADFSESPAPRVTPDVVSHDETVLMVWLAKPRSIG